MGAYFPYVSKERAGLTTYYDVYTDAKKIKGFKETLKSLPQSKPLNSVSLLELINTSTGIN